MAQVLDCLSSCRWRNYLAGPLDDIERGSCIPSTEREKLYLMVRDGDIPATKVASQWRFRKEEIDQWMIKLRSRERSSR